MLMGWPSYYVPVKHLNDMVTLRKSSLTGATNSSIVWLQIRDSEHRLTIDLHLGQTGQGPMDLISKCKLIFVSKLL